MNEIEHLAELHQNFRIKEVQVNTIEEFNELILNKKYDYFRGEQYDSWSLNASLVRKINSLLKGEEKYSLNHTNLQELLLSYKTEYNNYFSSRHSYSRFLFYMQHATSLSPFIDITKDIWIAISFCLWKDQQDDIKEIQNKSALYAIEVKKTKEENYNYLQTHTEVIKVLEGLSIGINKMNPKKGNVEAFVIDSYDLTMLNDRMSYQKGAFLFLNNYSILKNSKSNQEFNHPNIEMIKFILSENVMQELYTILKTKYPKYLKTYLENPYKVFDSIEFKL